MYSLGLDIGSSSVKVAIVNEATGELIASLHEPSGEMEIIALQRNWAEQHPETWWHNTCNAIQRILVETSIDPKLIQTIGIAYQMHGLVIIDENGRPLRNAIIWCDSRAVGIGNEAFTDLGMAYCRDHLLNSPGNFTASKLKWVKDNEPENYSRIYKYMLPGDYIAFKLTDTIHTTKNGLSEGILWDYQNQQIASELLEHYGIDPDLTPDIVENFTDQGTVAAKAAKETGLSIGTTVRYRAGDQPNNALTLGVFKPGQAALTGGTSGVIYAVTDRLQFNEIEKVNQFAHANYSTAQPNIGRLLNINGAGIQYRWLLNNTNATSYDEMNQMAKSIPVGSDGVAVIPFGNGSERMFNNAIIGTHIKNLNLNRHHSGHLFRAALEGIAFAFAYGMELLSKDDTPIHTLRAGNDNLFRSQIFGTTLATLIGQPIDIFNTTGAAGAARAATLSTENIEAFSNSIRNNDHVMTYRPIKDASAYYLAYEHWKEALKSILKNNETP